MRIPMKYPLYKHNLYNIHQNRVHVIDLLVKAVHGLSAQYQSGNQQTALADV